MACVVGFQSQGWRSRKSGGDACRPGQPWTVLPGGLAIRRGEKCWKESQGKGESVRCSVMSDSLRPHGLQPTRLLCPWNSACKNTGVGCHSLLQGIVPTQRVNLGLLHCRQILHHLSHQGSHQPSGMLLVGLFLLAPHP